MFVVLLPHSSSLCLLSLQLVSQMPLEMKKLHTMHDNLTRKGKSTVARQPPPSKEHHECICLMRDIAKVLNC